MSVARASMSCTACGYQASQWRGRCPQCGAWDSFVKDLPPPAPSGTNRNGTNRNGNRPLTAPPPPVVLAEVEVAGNARLATGIGEFDRVLGGGLVKGSVVLLAGEPGAGKSTLALQAAAGLEAGGSRVLIVCGEESVDQVAARARRLGGIRSTEAYAGTDLNEVLSHAAGFDVVIIDSIQTMSDPELTGEPGSVTQVRGCASELACFARGAKTALLLVGHVTKDGAIAGPRVLEHLVDAVLTFEGDRGQSLRTLRSAKNRFGGTADLGVFEMKSQGLIEVSDASRLFLADRHAGIPGSAVGCVLEGRRPVAMEVQSLVAPTDGAHPRRVAHGLSRERLEVLAAVLDRRAGINLSKSDVFARVAGGFRADEPAVDLALALALASARLDRSVPADLVAIGEVGLAGDVRVVPGIKERLGECARLGFRRAVAGHSLAHEGSLDGLRGLKVYPISRLREGLELLD